MFRIIILLLFLSLSFNLFSDDSSEDIDNYEYTNEYSNDTYDNIKMEKSTKSENDNSEDLNNKVKELQKEILSIKKEVNELKEQNLWFSFKFEGSSKTTFGVALWTKDGFSINSPSPVTLGFDFENNIRMGMDIANKIVYKNSTSAVEGTEISTKLKIRSNGLNKIRPEGSYYVMDATDDQGRKVKVYFPRYSGGSSNIVFGNFEVILEEALVKNIMGTGVFINYRDLFQVQEYYGVTSLVDVLKLNHRYFNNGYTKDKNDILYYSFDDRYYSPEVEDSMAVRFWSENMLFNNPNNSDANQRPHGLSLGFDGKISDGMHVYVEGGGASKDAFDPKYFEDNQIDAGFFLKGGINLFNKKFSFYPKLAFSFAFQTGTLDDVGPSSGYSTFSFGSTFPFFISLPTGIEDSVKVEASFNLNAHFATSSVAGILSLQPEFTLLNKKLSFKLPFIYSFKTKNGGFLRVGNENVKWLDQEAEDHIINFGIDAKFDTINLLGNFFQIVFKELFLFSYNAIPSRPEIFLFQIFRNEFVFTDIGPLKLSLYYEIGYGYTKEPRLVSSNYYYDSELSKWFDKSTNLEITIDHTRRWKHEASVLSFETGFDMLIMKNLSFGISIESPKLLVSSTTPIGRQNTFGIFKIWSEIKL